MAFTDFLDPVLGWLLVLPPIVAILIVSLIVGFFSTLLQKYTTDQPKLKRLRADTKKYQQQMREAQKAKDLQKLQKVQEKMMPLQLEMMKESFKPLIFTMIPALLIFVWLSGHLAFEPVQPGEPFMVTAIFEEGIAGAATLHAPDQLRVQTAEQQIVGGAASWLVEGDAGLHELRLTAVDGQIDVTREVLITNERAFVAPQKVMKGLVREFNVVQEKLTPWPGLNFFGWEPGWIFWYIAFSIPISLGLKKLLDVA